MISRGATDGDSNRTQKRYSRADCMVVRALEVESKPILGFEPNDLEEFADPHNDTLVIRATVANFDVARVFVDAGSLVNALFWTTKKQMGISIDDLQSITTPLFGFFGHAMQPLDQIKLSLSLGEEPRRQTILATFIVVDAPSSYNIILGQPILNAL